MQLDLSMVVERLPRLFDHFRELLLYALVFGSLARGSSRIDSDVDVGLRPKHGKKGELIKTLPDLIVDVADELGLPVEQVDLAILDVEGSGNLSFLYEALAYSVLVWGDRRAYAEDLARVASLYTDHLVQLRKHRYFERYAEAYVRRASYG